MRIGSIDIHRPICLAPMEDVSDIPFRLLCKRQGADIVYTEFTNCEALIRNVTRAVSKIRVEEEERPVAIQLYGSAEDSMREASEMATAMGPDFIDINCGCWVKKVANRGDGAGLLRDLCKFKSVVQAVQAGTPLPVTVKTRLGWNHESIVICEVARMVRDLGVAALTVHCRTRHQGYTGQADWSWLPRIKEATPDLTLIANGDITTPEHAAQLFEMGVDGVMIGRGAITSPWIFRQVKHYVTTGEHLPEPDLATRIEMCLEHLKARAAYRGERRGVLSFRRHYNGYLKSVANISHLRRELMTYEEVAPIEAALRRFAEDHESVCV